ncbi:MAG: DUF4290 domain-containing protein [Flavobacteriaceae bacterium]|nr:DUF4290 domain-containing protein [Flavobacteriaceae bacterium]
MKRLTRPQNVLDELDYNTQRADILLGEYGRNVQDMVASLPRIQDRETRSRYAAAIVQVMGVLNPPVYRDQADYKHKLWDHLHIMGKFCLDIETPFPVPSPEIVAAKPQEIPYIKNRIAYRYYGKQMERYLQRVSEMPDGGEKNMYTSLLGSFMKSSCKSWNDENVSDQAIVDHMNELSDNKLNLVYDGQEYSLDMSRSGKSVNPLIKDKKPGSKNKKKKFFKRK